MPPGTLARGMGGAVPRLYAGATRYERKNSTRAGCPFFSGGAFLDLKYCGSPPSMFPPIGVPCLLRASRMTSNGLVAPVRYSLHVVVLHKDAVAAL